jgi:hypothetical protein
MQRLRDIAKSTNKLEIIQYLQAKKIFHVDPDPDPANRYI